MKLVTYSLFYSKQLNPETDKMVTKPFMINSLITSKTKIKLLLRLFLKEGSRSYLRQMEKEFGKNCNSIRSELNRLEQAGLVTGEMENGRKYYSANQNHPLFNDINSILRKYVGIDQLIERITEKIGDLQEAYLTGNFAAGLDADTIELLLIGENLDIKYVESLVKKAEQLMTRKISWLVLNKEQKEQFFKGKPLLAIWKADEEVVGG